jgi:hypothetical protein
MSSGIHRRVAHILDSNLKLSREIRRLVRTNRFWVKGQKGQKSCRVDQESMHSFLLFLSKIDAIRHRGQGNPRLELRIRRKELFRLLHFFERMNKKAKRKTFR